MSFVSRFARRVLPAQGFVACTVAAASGGWSDAHHGDTLAQFRVVDVTNAVRLQPRSPVAEEKSQNWRENLNEEALFEVPVIAADYPSDSDPAAAVLPDQNGWEGRVWFTGGDPGEDCQGYVPGRNAAKAFSKDLFAKAFSAKEKEDLFGTQVTLTRAGATSPWTRKQHVNAFSTDNPKSVFVEWPTDTSHIVAHKFLHPFVEFNSDAGVSVDRGDLRFQSSADHELSGVRVQAKGYKWGKPSVEKKECISDGRGKEVFEPANLKEIGEQTLPMMDDQGKLAWGTVQEICGEPRELKLEDGTFLRSYLSPLGPNWVADRGVFGAWGPNNCADPIVTRFNTAGDLEILVIYRSADKLFAFPGGMKEDGSIIYNIVREMKEEAVGTLTLEQIEEKLTDGETAAKEAVPGHGDNLVFAGPLDGKRNTAHAWMWTTAKHYHVRYSDFEEPQAKDKREVAHVSWQKVSVMRKKNEKEIFKSHKMMLDILVTRLMHHGFIDDSCKRKEDAATSIWRGLEDLGRYVAGIW